jgi:hypothetical protein
LRARVSSGSRREIAEALTGAHFSWAQDQVIGVHGADRVAVLGEGELDGGKGVPGFEGADFGKADSVKFLEGEGAGAAACGEIGRERGDALKGSLGLGHRNRGPPVPPVERGETTVAW